MILVNSFFVTILKPRRPDTETQTPDKFFRTFFPLGQNGNLFEDMIKESNIEIVCFQVQEVGLSPTTLL